MRDGEEKYRENSMFFFGKFGEESFDFQNKWGDFINELKCILFCQEF